jgi:hypothetical protein
MHLLLHFFIRRSVAPVAAFRLGAKRPGADGAGKPGERGRNDFLEAPCTPERGSVRLLKKGAPAIELSDVARNAFVSGPEYRDSRDNRRARPAAAGEREPRGAPRAACAALLTRLALAVACVLRRAMPLSSSGFCVFPVVRLLHGAVILSAVFIAEIGARLSQILTICRAVVMCNLSNSRLKPLSIGYVAPGLEKIGCFRNGSGKWRRQCTVGFFLQGWGDRLGDWR